MGVLSRTIHGMPHTLTDVDLVALTATCAVCGPTRVRRRKRTAQTHKVAECRTQHRRHAQGGHGPRSDVERAAAVAAQGGVCPGCLRSDVLLVDDHCHTTGRPRGMLCTACNLILGRIERAGVDRAERLIDYAARYGAPIE